VDEPQDGDACSAAELALAAGLTREGLGLVGVGQLAVHAFAQALLQPAKALGENSDTPGDLAVLRQYRSHWETKDEGIQTWKESAPIMHHQAVLEGLGCKASAIQKATEAVLTVLTELLRPAGEDKMKGRALLSHTHTKQSEVTATQSL